MDVAIAEDAYGDPRHIADAVEALGRMLVRCGILEVEPGAGILSPVGPVYSEGR